MDDLQGDVLRIGRGDGGRQIRDQQHVGLGDRFLRVVVGIFPRDGLVEDRDRQEARVLGDELARRHGLAARDAGKVADDALDFLDHPSLEPFAGGGWQGLRPIDDFLATHDTGMPVCRMAAR